MALKNKTIKKSIFSSVIVFVFVFVFSFSFFFKKADAIPVEDFATEFSTAATASSSAADATTNTTHSIFVTILQETIKAIEKKLLQQMTKATVGWINSGFHGAPLYLQNPGSFFQDIAKSEVKTVINEYGYDLIRFPFGKAFALNTINTYKNQSNNNAAYSLSQVMNPIDAERYRNNFNAGGWNGFLINTQYPQNNYLGFQMMATGQLASKLQGTTQNAAQKVTSALQQGSGFLSPQMCPSNPKYNNGYNEFSRPSFDDSSIASTYDAPVCDGIVPKGCDVTSEDSLGQQMLGCDAAYAKFQQCQADADAYNTEYMKKYDAAKAAFNDPKGPNVCPGGLVATTPGAVVGNQIMSSMSSTYRQSELGSAVGSSISAILDALLNKFLQTGLSALGNAASSAPTIDNWSYFGNTLSSGGANTAGGSNTSSNTSTNTLSIPNTVAVSAGNSSTTILADGVGPYKITTQPDSGTARVQISGNNLTVTGVSSGQTSFTITDSSSPSKSTTVQVNISNPGDFVVSPSDISLGMENVTAVMSGGTQPYIVKTQPDEKIATVTIYGDTNLNITGKSGGKTSTVIQDSSVPIKTVTVNITTIDTKTPTVNDTGTTPPRQSPGGTPATSPTNNTPVRP